MIKISAYHEEAEYLSSMKLEGYVYFLFCGDNNLHYNGSKVYLFKSKEAAEEVAFDEYNERKRIYKIGKTFFIKDNDIYLEEIHELKFDIPSLSEFLWKQHDEKMWAIIKQDGTIQLQKNGLPHLDTEHVQSQSSIGVAIARLCHYTADGRPVIAEVKIFNQQ